MQRHRLAPPPSWARRISGLREKLGYTQAVFGAQLHYSAMAVSRWERGSHEPTSSCYIQMGNLSGPLDCWFFWQKAGLAVTDVVRHLPTPDEATRPQPLTIVAAGVSRKAIRNADPDLIALPVFALSAQPNSGNHAISLDDAAIVSMLAAPKTWCANPEQSRCLQVKGSSMSPMIREGDIVAIDTSQTAIAQLKDKIVVVSHAERGLIIATLRRFNGVDVLEPESREFESFPLDKGRNWHVLGRVLWWLSRAP